MKKEESQKMKLASDEERVLSVLRKQEPGVVLKQKELMKRASIHTARQFYSVIEQLRDKGFPVIGRKSEPHGYKLAETKEELLEWSRRIIKESNGAVQKAKKMEREFHNWTQKTEEETA